MEDKKTDTTSSSYQAGYKEGYVDKDKGMMDHFFEQITSVTKFTGGDDDYKEGFAQGERDRIRDDVQKDKEK